MQYTFGLDLQISFSDVAIVSDEIHNRTDRPIRVKLHCRRGPFLNSCKIGVCGFTADASAERGDPYSIWEGTIPARGSKTRRLPERKAQISFEAGQGGEGDSEKNTSIDYAWGRIFYIIDGANGGLDITWEP